MALIELLGGIVFSAFSLAGGLVGDLVNGVFEFIGLTSNSTD